MRYFIIDIRDTEDHLEHIGAINNKGFKLLSRKEPFITTQNVTKLYNAKSFLTKERAENWLCKQDCSIVFYKVISRKEISGRK